MTRENTKCLCDKNLPFILRPAAKDYLWGGSRLNDEFNFDIPVSPFAEAWVCSTHSDGVSIVSGSELYLSEVLIKHPEYLGSHVLQLTEGLAELPILIKLIDAKDNLSVQVHPDDDYANKFEGQWGKTEMWYVLGAKSNSRLVYGFNQDVDKSCVINAIENKNINELLNYVPVHKDDIFYIESGTVHAIGAGCLIAEIQQSSNLTYRLYDYDRIDKYGNKRTLHVKKALDVAKLESSMTPRQPMRVLKYKSGCAYELLARCKYFQVERMLLNTQNRVLTEFQTGSNTFHALLCIEGCGVLFGQDFTMNFFKGDCIFIPAESIKLTLHGRAQILNVSC